MPSLRQIRAAHPRVLVLDAASAQIQVGDGGDIWQTSMEEAGVGIFQCLEKLSFRVEDVDAFVFCDGPGSVLGIRTVAMAIRTWGVLKPSPIYSYCSLAVVAHAVRRADVGIIADARRELWHHYQIGHGLRRAPLAELNGELIMPEGFRHWSQLPAAISRVPYRVSELLTRVLDADLFRRTELPDAFLHEEPNYVGWTPQIHRRPAQ